jgi:hypothetical protein
MVIAMAVCLSAVFAGWRVWKRAGLDDEIAAGGREADEVNRQEKRLGSSPDWRCLCPEDEMAVRWREEEAVSRLEERLGNSIDLDFFKLRPQDDDVRSYYPVCSAEIQGAVIDQHTWSDLQAFRYLWRLTITDCRFAPGMKVDFSPWSHLTCLAIVDCHFAAGMNVDYAPASHLSTLTVCRSSLPLEDIRRLIGHSRLLSLKIIDAGATSEWLQWIGQLHELNVLELDGIRAFSEDDIGCLAGLTRLEKLTLPRLPLTPKSASVLANLENLKWLLLVRAEIKHGSLKPLTNLKKLRALHLDGSDLSDADAPVLSEFSHLLFLSLADTRITDKSLKELVPLKGLYFLDLSRTDITASALRRLLTAMPKLHWDADGTRLSEEELKKLYEEFPGEPNEESSLELGYFM